MNVRARYRFEYVHSCRIECSATGENDEVISVTVKVESHLFATEYFTSDQSVLEHYWCAEYDMVFEYGNRSETTLEDGSQ